MMEVNKQVEQIEVHHTDHSFTLRNILSREAIDAIVAFIAEREQSIRDEDRRKTLEAVKAITNSDVIPTNDKLGILQRWSNGVCRHELTGVADSGKCPVCGYSEPGVYI
jgi:hypothetical protein